MYAYKISRNCGHESNCVTLGIDNCSRLTIGPTTVLGLFVRMYLEPAIKVCTRYAGDSLRSRNQVFAATVGTTVTALPSHH